MDEQEVIQVDECEREPCKGSVLLFHSARGNLEEAAGVVTRLAAERAALDKPLYGSLGVALVGVILVVGTAGAGVVVGAVLIGGGAAGTAISGLDIRSANRRLRVARDECARARAAFNKARDDVFRNCPRRCWPESFSGPACG